MGRRSGVAGGPRRRVANLCKLATAIAMTVLATGRAAADPVELVCSHSDDTLYTVPGTRCGAYYRCHQMHPVRFRCTEGAMFDFHQQKCVRSEGTCYEAICGGKTDGVYADASQACRRSYRCRGGSMISTETCPSGQLFDGRACVAQARVTCESAEATSASFQYEADPRCYGLPDGNHLLPGGDAKDCKKYLRCEADQVLDVLECPPGYRFDSRSSRCTWLAAEDRHPRRCHPSEDEHAGEFGSDAACAYLPDGFHLAATSRDCRAYIECRARQLAGRHECSPLTVFNGQQCVPGFLYHCPRLDPSGDICHQRHDGFHVDPRKGCAYYVRCAAQRTAEELSCPYGFHYDASGSGACLEDHRGAAGCHRVPYSADCAQRASGYYQDFASSGCRGYYHCHNGAKTSLRCGPGQAFDGENCVPQAAYRCPADDVDSCRGKPNGYHKDARAGCRAYHLCSEGNKISYLCAPGQLFADGRCRARVASRDEPCMSDSVCAGRSDGYYPDRESQCRQYFFCQRGEKLQTLTCRGSRIFDGRSCVSRGAFVCPAAGPGSTATDDVDAAASENCIARSCEPSCARGGFYADYDTGCEQYFFCIDGKPSTLSCSAGHVFNGEICVPRDTYYCPRYCTPPEAC